MAADGASPAAPAAPVASAAEAIAAVMIVSSYAPLCLFQNVQVFLALYFIHLYYARLHLDNRLLPYDLVVAEVDCIAGT